MDGPKKKKTFRFCIPTNSMNFGYTFPKKKSAYMKLGCAPTKKNNFMEGSVASAVKKGDKGIGPLLMKH